MRSYEHTFIARQDLSPQQAQALADTYAGVIAEHGGEVTKNEYWGLRNLAYRIKKNRKGHYLHLNLRADAAAIDEIERQERLSDDVIRYLTVRVDQLDDGPSIIMQVRSTREERSRRPHEDGPRRFHDDGPRRSHDDGPRRSHDDGPRRSHDGERPRRPAEPSGTDAAESATSETAE
jgi:small subunit ribosomal protein S6